MWIANDVRQQWLCSFENGSSHAELTRTVCMFLLECIGEGYPEIVTWCFLKIFNRSLLFLPGYISRTLWRS